LNINNLAASPAGIKAGAKQLRIRSLGLSFGSVCRFSPGLNEQAELRFAPRRDVPTSAPTFTYVPGGPPISPPTWDRFQILGIPSVLDEGPSVISALVWRTDTTGSALVFDRCDEELRSHLLHWHRTTNHLPVVVQRPLELTQQCIYLESCDEVERELCSTIPDNYQPNPLRLWLAMRCLQQTYSLRGITPYALLAASEEKLKHACLAGGDLFVNAIEH